MITATFAGDATDYGTSADGNLTINPANVTSQISGSESGLVYNRSTQLFGGNITMTNAGLTNLIGTLVFEFTGLPAGVTLANATGIAADGSPFISINLPNGILRRASPSPSRSTSRIPS